MRTDREVRPPAPYCRGKPAPSCPVTSYRLRGHGCPTGGGVVRVFGTDQPGVKQSTTTTSS